MELTNEFVIDRDVEETWTILNDLEFIAPCMPGAQLTEIEGDEYRGLVKIKVGPITANYKGKASFVEQDATNRVAKLKAEGRDPRQGNANAMVTARMAPAGTGPDHRQHPYRPGVEREDRQLRSGSDRRCVEEVARAVRRQPP